MATEQDFNDFIATVPGKIRDQVRNSAHQNTFSVDVTSTDRTADPKAWDEAIETAHMIADTPADFGI